jgi:hypothetical protein
MIEELAINNLCLIECAKLKSYLIHQQINLEKIITKKEKNGNNYDTSLGFTELCKIRNSNKK